MKRTTKSPKKAPKKPAGFGKLKAADKNNKKGKGEAGLPYA